MISRGDYKTVKVSGRMIALSEIFPGPACASRSHACLIFSHTSASEFISINERFESTFKIRLPREGYTYEKIQAVWVGLQPPGTDPRRWYAVRRKRCRETHVSQFRPHIQLANF